MATERWGRLFHRIMATARRLDDAELRGLYEMVITRKYPRLVPRVRLRRWWVFEEEEPETAFYFESEGNEL